MCQMCEHWKCVRVVSAEKLHYFVLERLQHQTSTNYRIPTPTTTACYGLHLSQMVPGQYIIAPASSASVEYQAMASLSGLTPQLYVVSSRTVNGSLQGDVGQTSMTSTLRNLDHKTSPFCQTAIGNRS